MSARVFEIRLQCDMGSGCKHAQKVTGGLVGSWTHVRARNVAGARKSAREQQGWRYTRRQGQMVDLCPWCAGTLK